MNVVLIMMLKTIHGTLVKMRQPPETPTVYGTTTATKFRSTNIRESHIIIHLWSGKITSPIFRMTRFVLMLSLLNPAWWDDPKLVPSFLCCKAIPVFRMPRNFCYNESTEVRLKELVLRGCFLLQVSGAFHGVTSWGGSVYRFVVGNDKVGSLNTGNHDVGSDDINNAVDTREIISRVKPDLLSRLKSVAAGAAWKINTHNSFKTGWYD